MYCPVCREVLLVMADRQGVEIDYCPQCRGVWLDRGELDKIIERVAQGRAETDTPQQQDRGAPQYRERRDDDDYDKKRGYDNDYDKKKKRRGLLGELFDFD